MNKGVVSRNLTNFTVVTETKLGGSIKITSHNVKRKYKQQGWVFPSWVKIT